MDENTLIHWVVTGAVGVGSGIISWLLRRAVDDMDEKIEDHAKQARENATAIADMRVAVARTDAGNASLGEQLKLVRHDLRDIRTAVEGLTSLLAQQLGRGK